MESSESVNSLLHVEEKEKMMGSMASSSEGLPLIPLMKPLDSRACSKRRWVDYIGIALCCLSNSLYVLFFGLYFILVLYIFNGGQEYPGIANIGFHIHATTGMVYFLAGGLQFIPPLRQYYPVVHRITGTIFYIMAFITSIGIVWIASTSPKAGFAAQVITITALPPWLLITFLAYRAIAVYRDVELHRKLNILGLSLSTSIIFMRPMFSLFMVINPSWGEEQNLGLAMWVCFVWGLFLASLYIYFAYTRPTSQRLVLQHGGSFSYHSNPSSSFVPVRIVASKRLDERTLHFRFQLEGPMSVSFPPGSHIALQFGKVVREYTPIAIDKEKNEFEVIIRLVPGGQMSKLLNSSGPSKFEQFSVYGPLFPLPARFGYLPSFVDDLQIETLIMVAGGTGITPFLSTARAALLCPRDSTKLRLLVNTGRDCEGFHQFAVDQAEALKQLESSTGASRNRLDVQIKQHRFSFSMISHWVGTGRGVAVWICGPQAMSVAVRKEILNSNLKLKSQQIFVLGLADR